MDPIPQEWIRDYVDSLLEAAKEFGADSRMAQAAMQRADTILDMVKAFRDRQSKDSSG